MPLPPALAARLAKRGLLKNARDEEEIIAENYDDDEEAGNEEGPRSVDISKKSEDKTRFLGYPGCPNKVNPYHFCSSWCLNNWGRGKLKPEPAYRSRYEAMMKKYTLPETWREKYDPGTGRHYFWCTRTDKVSWLPPGHPKFKPVEAASMLREILGERLREERDEEEDSDDSNNDERDDMDLDSDESEDEEIEERRRRDKERRRKEYDRYRGGRRDRGDHDPMDPSSYSDAPRGAWSSGLDESRGSSRRSK